MQFLFLIIVLALLVPMFLMSRRQKKVMAKTADMQDGLKLGDRVLLTSGLHATVVDLADTTVDLEIADGIVATWERMAVRQVLTDDDDATDLDDELDDLDDFDDTEETDTEETAADEASSAAPAPDTEAVSVKKDGRTTD